MVANDRREFQRLRLAKPILALMDGQNALILDIGIAGAYIEHYGALPPGARFKLLFRWQRADVELLCDARLNDMMATFVGRVLAAQRANASGKPEEGETLSLAQLGGARRARTRGWVSFRLVDGTWHRTLAASAAQPLDGFTVAAYEDEEELASLCETYETADAEGRRLIRLLAELSARNAIV